MLRLCDRMSMKTSTGPLLLLYWIDTLLPPKVGCGIASVNVAFSGCSSRQLIDGARQGPIRLQQGARGPAPRTATVGYKWFAI